MIQKRLMRAQTRKRKKLFGLTFPDFLIALICVGALAAVWNLSALFPPPPAAQPPAVATLAFDTLSLEARAAFVLDGKTGVKIWEKDGEAQLPLASLTKVMTAVTALSLASENTVIFIEPESLETEGDSGLFAGEKWKLGDLLALTLLESSNDGADAVAVTLGRSLSLSQSATAADVSADESVEAARKRFVTEMSVKSAELSLREAYFLNPTGLDETGYVSGGYGSARDVAVLFSDALKKYPEIFEVTRYDSWTFISESGLKHTVKNTNNVTVKIPSLLASKTGFTDLAGGNLVIAFDAGVDRPIFISVLGSSEKGRFSDAEKLVWATLEQLRLNDR